MASDKSLGKPCIKDLHSHLVCGICMGYFVDATTINECLHTFCRSCIVKYLDTSNFCPMCDVQIHKSRPLQNLRPDKMLQDLVYKVVPGFYATEMQKRRDYFNTVKDKALLTNEAENLLTPELRGEPGESKHYSPDESITLSLEYYVDNNDENEEEVEEEETEEKSEPDDKANPTRRYFKCPAAVCIRILKKLLRSKYGLSENDKVDIIYKSECLPEHFTLIDVGYIYSCKKKGLLKLYFRFYSKPNSTNAASTKSVKRTITDSANCEVKRPRVNSVESNSSVAESRNLERLPSQPISTTNHTATVPHEEPEQRTAPCKDITPAPRLPSPRRGPEKKPDEKQKRVISQENSEIPAKKQKAEPPKPVQKPEAAPASTPKAVSQPPKPIQPGLKPPSQTSLLLKQQIAQQREQQKHQQQQQQFLKMQRLMMNQKQAKPGAAKIDRSPVAAKQLPQLQKLNQKAPLKNNMRPVMPQPTTASIGTQSLPIVSKTPESMPKQVASVAKPSPQVMSTKAPQVQTQKTPTSSAPTTSSVATSFGKTVSASPSTNPSPSQTTLPSEQRRITNEMIEKNKLRPVVVIERHGNGRPKVKQVPSPLKLHQQMSREFNKISTDQTPTTPKPTNSATTLAVAPTDSATKVKIVKTPTTSPNNNEQSKASETKKTPQETPKGKTQPDGTPGVGVLDLSGKSSRKSDSPCSSVGSPSPPAPKVSSPPTPTEQRRSPPTQPPSKAAPTPIPPIPKHSWLNKPIKPNSTESKIADILKIAQSSLNEKLPFFRQTQPQLPSRQAPSPPNSQNPGMSKINSFSYQSLMNDALMRSNAYAHIQKQHQQQNSQKPHQNKARAPNSQAQRPPMGPRSTMSVGTSSKSSNSGSMPIRIPNPGKNSPPRQVMDGASLMAASRVQSRIHDLFPGPQQSKPGPNQAVRHIPNPSLLGRQNTMRMQHIDISPASVRKDEITITPARNPAASGSSPMSSLRKIETLTQSLQRNLCDGKLSAPPSMSIGVVATEASQ